MELEYVNELEFESNSLPFVFGCVISNWNLNVILPLHNHLWVFLGLVVGVSGRLGRVNRFWGFKILPGNRIIYGLGFGSNQTESFFCPSPEPNKYNYKSDNSKNPPQTWITIPN